MVLHTTLLSQIAQRTLSRTFLFPRTISKVSSRSTKTGVSASENGKQTTAAPEVGVVAFFVVRKESNAVGYPGLRGFAWRVNGPDLGLTRTVTGIEIVAEVDAVWGVLDGELAAVCNIDATGGVVVGLIFGQAEIAFGFGQFRSIGEFLQLCLNPAKSVHHLLPLVLNTRPQLGELAFEPFDLAVMSGDSRLEVLCSTFEVSQMILDRRNSRVVAVLQPVCFARYGGQLIRQSIVVVVVDLHVDCVLVQILKPHLGSLLPFLKFVCGGLISGDTEFVLEQSVEMAIRVAFPTLEA